VGSVLPERVPVIVQQLIDADASGVLFTRDPHAGAAVTVIEASWGLGTSVVDGSVVPDLVTVADDDTVSTRRGDKQTRVDCSTVGVTTSHVAAPDRARPCLSDDEARQLAALGVVVATLVGGPVDIEWAIAGGRVWLLQVRPVTARPPQPPGTTSPDVTGLPLVRGTGAGRGTATGPARVVRDVDGFGSVRPGDVLLCRTTDPAWTPLFGVVAAVVTETGGILSHAAIVAREVGIPAVVGAARAMAVVTGGSIVHVDGDAGTVSRFAPGDGGQQ
jgi:pyruvate,water dikinase